MIINKYIHSGNLERVQLYLTGFSIDNFSIVQHYPNLMLEACKTQYLHIVKYFVEDFKIELDKQAHFPFWIACLSGNMPIIKYLFKPKILSITMNKILILLKF